MGSVISRPQSAKNAFKNKNVKKNPRRTQSVPAQLDNSGHVTKLNELIQIAEKPVGEATKSCGKTMENEVFSQDLDEIIKDPNSKYLHGFSLFNIITQESWNQKLQICATDYLLLLDCRGCTEFKKSKIATAVHHSEYDNLLKTYLQQVHLIILYGMNGHNEIEIENLSKKLEAENHDHFILKYGYCDFAATYPFLCTEKMIKTESERMNFFRLYPSEILPGKIYQGNAEEALSLEVLDDIGITHIVNVTSEHPNKFQENGKDYLRIHLDDHPTSDLKSWLAITSKYIHTALTSDHKNKVLVHCNMGRSRSSTVVLGYFMDHINWSLIKSSNWLKECRPTVIPNNGFILQLLAYEKQVFGEIKSTLNEIPF